MKKKVTAFVLAVCMALTLTACGGSGAENSGTAAGSENGAAEVETVKEGVLTVATSPDFAPYEFYALDENGNPTLAGFDMALAKYIADYMGLELEVVTVDFDGVLMELQTKSVDLGMAGLSPDPTRENAMDFSDIYYRGGQSFVTVQDHADEYKTLEDANKDGISVGAQTGSIQLDLANQYSADTDIVSLPKVTDIITELLAGKLDAAYIETDVAISYQRNYPELAIVLDVPYEVEGSAIGVSKGNTALLQAVNKAIAAALEDGSLENFVAEANELASGEKYEGLLNEEGEVQE